MVDQVTTNYKLWLPEFDKRGWQNRFYDNMRIVDAAITQIASIAAFRGVWENATAYAVSDKVVDTDSSTIFECDIAHTSSAAPETFADDRAAFSTYWINYTVPSNFRGAWATNTGYRVGDWVVDGYQFAVCIVAHTSGTFSADVAAAKWVVVVDLTTTVATITASETAAAASAAAALVSQTSAATSATSAATSATSAATSATSAATSATSAATSATSAATSATSAATSATSAATSATSAATSATSAATSATSAATSATSAATSATSAATSATSAATSAAAAAAAAGTNLFNTISDQSASFSVTADTDDGTLFNINSASSNINMTLPSIATALEGERYGIYRVSASNTITLVRNGSDTINGVAGNYTLNAVAGELTVIVADDATPDNWIVFVWSQAVAGTGLSKTGSTLNLNVGNENVWTAPQIASPLTDNDGSFDISAKQNFVCTPAAAIAITFTNFATRVGLSGYVELINTGGKTITFASHCKGRDGLASALSTAGTYILGFRVNGAGDTVHIFDTDAMVSL